jgi:hypothetical protein
MTGAGSATAAFVKEDSFQTEPADPTYYLPGRNLTIEDIELQNLLERLRDPDAVEAIESIAGRIEGAFAANWAVSADTHEHVRDIVFNDAGTGFTSGAAATSAWYLGVDYLSGTAQRALSGVVPTEYSLSYDGDANTITASLTALYADETKATSITPTSITGPTNDSTVPFHGWSLDVDGATVQKLQSATLSVSNIARYITGPERTPLDAVIAAPESSLSFNAVFDGPDHIDLAYGGGGTSVSSTQDTVEAVPGTLTLSQGGSPVATYSLPQIKPDSYNWSDLVNGDNDLTEDVQAHVNGGLSIA